MGARRMAGYSPGNSAFRCETGQGAVLQLAAKQAVFRQPQYRSKTFCGKLALAIAWVAAGAASRIK